MLSNDPPNGNDQVLKKIIESWILFQNEMSSEQAFTRHILSNLDLIAKEQDKIAYILNTKEILNTLLQAEFLNQSQEYNKKTQIKDVLFKNLLLLVCLEIEKDFMYQTEIRKLIREQEAEFHESLERIRQEQEDWDMTISLHIRQVMERMERDLFIQLLYRDIRNIKKSVQITLADKVMTGMKAMSVEFLEKSGFNTEQMKEFQKISDESFSHFSNSSDAFETSLTQLDKLDSHVFASEDEIDSAVENEMQLIKRKMSTLLQDKVDMHEASKEFIRRTTVSGKTPKENIQLYENLVEHPSNNLLAQSLNALIEQRANSLEFEHEHENELHETQNLEKDEQWNREKKAVSESEFQGRTTQESEPAGKSFTPLEQVNRRKFLRRERSVRGGEAGRAFDFEMQRLEEKLQELEKNKKRQLKGRAKLISRHQKEGGIYRSQLDPKESLKKLIANQEQFAQDQKAKPSPKISEDSLHELKADQERFAQDQRSKLVQTDSDPSLSTTNTESMPIKSGDLDSEQLPLRARRLQKIANVNKRRDKERENKELGDPENQEKAIAHAYNKLPSENSETVEPMPKPPGTKPPRT